ncbi:hypothetical protein [Verrucomicrobium sp. BvORR034]|uniref:hypothetical protein n=1 Tax=Verrucomicrobium sp. BvORR034 TaxID=1396418 RepID=UPI000679A363|nr:hypothetical protein [Verrucomicrobium sp. BvORR034]
MILPAALVQLPELLASTAAGAASAAAFKVTAASVLNFLTQTVLVVAAGITVYRWRWSALGLVLFLFKPYLPIVLDYWVDAFFPIQGNAALERWHLFIQISNLITAIALLISLRLIVRREMLGGFLEPKTRTKAVKKRTGLRRRRTQTRQD